MGCCKCEEYKWEDPQPVVYTDPEGKGYCLFHAPAEHKVATIDEFNDGVMEYISDTKKFDSEDAICNLSGTIFPDEIRFTSGSSLPKISFDEAHFKRDVYFEKCHFKGDVSFKRCVFDGNVFFRNAKFRKTPEIEAAIFNGHVSFASASFFDHSSFKGTHFNHGATFFSAKFIERVFFTKTHFDGEAEFGGSEFRVGGDFSDAKFNFQVNFNSSCLDSLTIFKRVTFKYGCSFYKMSLHSRILLDSARVEGPIFFKEIQVEDNARIEFINTVILSGITFQKFDPTCIDFTEQRDLTNIHFIDASWEKGERIKACTEDQEDKLQLTRDFYQRMKAKYKAENNEYEASKWHIAEKEAQLKLLAQDKNATFNWFMLWLYKQSSLFGEFPRRAFKVLLLFIVLPLLLLLMALGMDIQIDFFGWTFHSSSTADVIGEWLKYIPLTRAMAGESSSGWRALMFFWQLLITVQAALFAFALRNNFRR